MTVYVAEIFNARCMAGTLPNKEIFGKITQHILKLGSGW